MYAHFVKYKLNFKQASGTSRGVLHTKDTYFLILKNQDKQGIGECNLFKGLSADDVPNYESVLQSLCDKLNSNEVVNWEDYREFPSIQFGYEQALLSLYSGTDILFPSEFTQGEKGIKINGLIWMGNLSFLKNQIDEKLKQGFSCIKLKIGSDWEEEKRLLSSLREKYPEEKLELRVDANGAFSFEKAQQVLEDLANLKIHSIEQPIKAKQWKEMSELCKNTPTPIALDEELIGVFEEKDKADLLEAISPQYIILKPALVGGFRGSKEWIDLAEKKQIDWWITSALESNIGLNALAQWTYTLKNPMPQGLGTGGLFTNNLDSNLEIKGEKLFYNPTKNNRFDTRFYNR